MGLLSAELVSPLSDEAKQARSGTMALVVAGGFRALDQSVFSSPALDPTYCMTGRAK
jgi:hypothetical protein